MCFFLDFYVGFSFKIQIKQQLYIRELDKNIFNSNYSTCNTRAWISHSWNQLSRQEKCLRPVPPCLLLCLRCLWLCTWTGWNRPFPSAVRTWNQPNGSWTSGSAGSRSRSLAAGTILWGWGAGCVSWTHWSTSSFILTLMVSWGLGWSSEISISAT